MWRCISLILLVIRCHITCREVTHISEYSASSLRKTVINENKSKEISHSTVNKLNYVKSSLLVSELKAFLSSQKRLRCNPHEKHSSIVLLYWSKTQQGTFNLTGNYWGSWKAALRKNRFFMCRWMLTQSWGHFLLQSCRRISPDLHSYFLLDYEYGNRTMLSRCHKLLNWRIVALQLENLSWQVTKTWICL